jgi:cell division transport system permease protein
VWALRHYLSLHKRSLASAVSRFASQPFASLLTVLVIGIALALPAGLRVLVNNASSLSDAWQGAADFTVYLKLDVTSQGAARAVHAIETRPDVASVTLIDRDAALAEFRAKSGFGDALDALEGNPLPHTLVVRPKSGLASDIETMAAAIKALPETDIVQLDTAWVSRLRAMLVLAGRAVDLATGLLALAVAIVVGNTIRLEINSRAQEIEVTKLVGGSDAFIRRPFLYLGFCYGLAGALLAAALLGGALLVLKPPVRELSALYGSGFALAGLSLEETAALLAGGAVLGWAGAGLATARHLRAIEPK